MNRFTRPPKISNLLDDNAKSIEQAIHETMPKAGFRIRSIQAEQNKRAGILASSEHIHLGWNSLDASRSSAACRFEWMRLMILINYYDLSVLEALESNAFYVTIADKRWQGTADELSPTITVWCFEDIDALVAKIAQGAL